jgi:Fibronectin type III domain
MKVPLALRRTALATALGLAATPMFAGASFGVALPAPPPPATPANVALVSGNKALAVSWTESSSGTINFVVTAKAAGKPARTCRTKANACAVTALVNGAIYAVTVVAKNTGGASNPSAPQTALVGVPGPPLNVHTTAGTAMATVSWAPPKASGVANVTGYHVTASPGGYSCSTAATLLIKAARTCAIAGLTSGTTYSVTVTATNASGTGLPSKSATVTPS